MSQSTRLPMFVCAIMALLFLAYDIWYVAFGRMEENGHIPFFLPIVCTSLTAICWRIDRIDRALSREDMSDRLPPC